MLDARAVWNVDCVIHRYFDALVLRIVCGHRHGVRLGVNLDGNTLQVRLLLFRGLDGMDFHFVAVPPLHFHSAVDVLQLKGASGLQRVGLIKFLADGEAGNGPYDSQNQYTQSNRAESWTKHSVLPPSSTS